MSITVCAVAFCVVFKLQTVNHGDKKLSPGGVNSVRKGVSLPAILSTSHPLRRSVVISAIANHGLALRTEETLVGNLIVIINMRILQKPVVCDEKKT